MKPKNQLEQFPHPGVTVIKIALAGSIMIMIMIALIKLVDVIL